MRAADPVSPTPPRRAGCLAAYLYIALLGVFPAAVRAEDAPAASQAADAPTADTRPVGAQTADSPAAAAAAPELPPILIDAAKTSEAKLVERRFDTPDDVTGFGETIEAAPVWRGFESPAELLGESVGAQINRQGGRDDFATLSIRGAPSAQLRILLDGVTLGRAADSVVNLADLPVDTVERIEVYRGFSPVGLTPTSAAGVVNVVTRDPEKPVATAAAGGGSFGSAKVNAGGAGPLAGGGASAFASYRHTDGDFEYIDTNGTPNNPNDDTKQKRRNNDSDTVESLLRWRRDLADALKMQLREHVFWKDEGVPGIARTWNTGARLETTRNIAAASLGGRDNRWSVEENVTWQRQRLYDYGAFDNTGDTTAATTVARWGRPLGDAHWLSGSSEYTWEGFDQTADSSSQPKQEATRSSLAAGLGDDWTVAPIDTTFTFQLRHQQLWNDTNSAITGGGGDAHSTDPRAGLRWNALPGLDVKANVATYFRPPNFDEMYGTDGFTTGNPALKPEQGLTWDSGFEWKASRDPFRSLKVGYAYFGSDIDDVIVVLLTFDRRAKAVNAAKARIDGHEARLEWQGPAGFALSANYTYQNAENRSSAAELHGKDLPNLPRHEFYGRLSWSWRKFVIAYGLEVTGHYYTDFENFQERSTRTEHDLSLVYGPFWKGFRVTLEADNLGNTMVPDPTDYPLPSRGFFATLSWSSTPDGEDDAR